MTVAFITSAASARTTASATLRSVARSGVGAVAHDRSRRAQELDYLAADHSPLMLRRGRSEADRRGIHWIEFAETDLEAPA